MLRLTLYISVVWLLLMDTGVGQPQRRPEPRPDKVERSVIQEVDGYALLGEDMTPRQARKLAFANAKRQALEGAHTYIKSQTGVRDGILQYDEIRTDAQGAVTVLAQRDHGLTEDNRYHVWVKAKVVYTLRPTSPQVSDNALADPAAPLTVNVWTDKKHYREGEHIAVFVQGNRDFYARVVNLSAAGQIIQLLPNQHRSSTRFTGQTLYRIPSESDKFALRAMSPFGEDRIIVYASEMPLGKVKMQNSGGGLSAYAGTLRELETESFRTIQLSSRARGQPGGAAVYEATWTFTTSQ
ncbi:MAG: DUF4384 domain-containing protein [Candidatus Tectomicrobia bacterium]|nr:DUF4384 domain-containing protein [Candidatus Tectomicrobia bacterium]